MDIFSTVVVAAVIVVFLTDNIGGVFGIRFMIDGRECFSHEAKHGATVRFSFVVVNVQVDDGWLTYGTDLVVKNPNGEKIQEFRDKTSGKSEFIAYKEGLYQFCFSNESPYQETLDFDVHSSYFYKDVEHAKDDHFNPILEQMSKLEDAFHKILFEQHWLQAEADRHTMINERMSKRAIHKALMESVSLIVASLLQVYLLKRLFERKLRVTSV